MHWLAVNVASWFWVYLKIFGNFLNKMKFKIISKFFSHQNLHGSIDHFADVWFKNFTHGVYIHFDSNTDADFRCYINQFNLTFSLYWKTKKTFNQKVYTIHHIFVVLVIKIRTVFCSCNIWRSVNAIICWKFRSILSYCILQNASRSLSMCAVVVIILFFEKNTFAEQLKF